MKFRWDGFQKAINTLNVPDGLDFFLDLYSWESIFYCIIAPLFLAIPIMLMVLSVHFPFLVCILLFIVALMISFPWLVVPYWIVKEKSGQRQKLLIWGIYNACFIVVYFALFIR